MLAGLNIRNVVLVDRLELSFESGLNVLTGETGAGKSILLDALGLALGARAEKNLLRPGTDQASVTAFFAIGPHHPARHFLADRDINVEGDMVIVRRVMATTGASRAYVNDQPVSVALVREVGRLLVEVQGQNDQQILVETASHRGLLDNFIGHDERLATLAESYARYRDAMQARDAFRESHQRALAEQDYLRHVVDELAMLAPAPGEEAELAASRAVLLNGEKVASALANASASLIGDDGAEMALHSGQRALAQIPEELRSSFEALFQALDRAVIETAEAVAELDRQRAALDLDPSRLGEVEDRLFKLRDLARKHGVKVDELAPLHQRLAAKLADIERGDDRGRVLEGEVEESRGDYLAHAQSVSQARCAAATQFAQAVTAELMPLKLDKAMFRTDVLEVGEDEWSAAGIDRVTLRVSTIPGAEPGPLGRVASGGELSRLLLAIKVVLAGIDGPSTLVFDEVDRGLGGATADAVGARLGRLAEQTQILVVTHSPQVAARAAHHWRVLKVGEGPRSNQVTTTVEHLDGAARREEIARMLAGAEVTNEARAAAESLISGQRDNVAAQ